MDRFPSAFLLSLSALLVGSSVCWATAHNDTGNETPQFQELPAEAANDQAPAATSDWKPIVPAAAAPEATPAIPATVAPAEGEARPSGRPEPTPAVTIPSVTKATPVRARVPTSKHYQVRIWQTDGECLWRIAEKVYGDRSKWRLIYMANKDVIHDPNKIYPKQRLKIPPPDWNP